MVDLKNIPKNECLTIPIEMYIFEVIIKNNQKLTEMEKIILKYIYIEDSVKRLLEDLNVDYFIKNKTLAKLLYRGLLRLKLDEARFQISDKIRPYLKNDNLEDYLDEAAVSESRTVSILQEKIYGEIFLENSVKDYLKNPGSLTTDYKDLRIISLDSFLDIKDISLNKFIQCIRNQIKDNLADIEKIYPLSPRHFTKLYIPLVKKEGKTCLDLDFEIFPRRVQKAWQNTYEIDFNIATKEDPIEILSEDSQFISNHLFQIYFKRDLILFEEALKKFDKSKKSKNYNRTLLMNFDDLKKGFNSLIGKIRSVNKVSFYHEHQEFLDNLDKYFSEAKDYIIICSASMSSDAIELLPSILNNLRKDVKLILLYNNLINIDDPLKFKREIKSKFKEVYRKDIHLVQSRISFSSNFIMVDVNYLFYLSDSLLSQNNYPEELSYPFLIIEGGTVSRYFLEFCFDLFPQNFEIRNLIHDQMSSFYKKPNNELSEGRLNYIKQIQNIKTKLKRNIMNYSLEELPAVINEIKPLISQLDQYDNVSIIEGIEHNDILIDVMRETNKNIVLYTDTLHMEQLGPHFMKYLKRIPKFQIILNDIEQQDETQRHIGISRLKKIIQTNPNLELEIKHFPVFNSLYVEDNFIIFTNNRFLERFRRKKVQKEISIIVYSQNVDKFDAFF